MRDETGSYSQDIGAQARHKCRWSPEDEEVSWVSLFYQPTSKELLTGYRVNPEDLRAVFEGFIRACVPAESHVYGRLCTPYNLEYRQIVEDLRSGGITMLTMDEARRRTGLLRSLLKGKEPRYVFVGDVTRQQVSSWYDRYAGWWINPYEFLVSSIHLDNWVERVLHLEDRVLRKGFLKSVGSYLTNHYDEGMEFISLGSKVEALEAEANVLSRKLNVSLEVQEKSTPK